MALCEVVYAGVLCIAGLSGGTPAVSGQSVTMEFSDGWPVSGATVSGEGWTAGVIVSSDALTELNPLVLTQACEGDDCVRYHRYCERDDGLALVCRFTVQGPPGQPLRIEVKAKDADAARAAQRSISVLAPKGAQFPLEALLIRSNRKSPDCQRLRRSENGPVYEAGCEFMNR